MLMLKRICFIIYCLFNRNVERKAEWLKKHNIFKGFGDNNRFAPFWIPSDAKYITFHNNISISSGTAFICHDTINSLIRHLDRYKHDLTVQGLKNSFTGIEIFDNVFIGANCILCPGVKVGPNAVIAAGAVVTKDVPPGSVVGGVPAKVIGSFDELVERRVKSLQNQ